MRKKCLETIYKAAKQDSRVLFIGSDLGPGVLDSMKKEMPERFFMEGISEQHIIGMSAGLAFDGFLPFVNTISTFLTRRCFEQITLDLCLHDLPVKLVGNGGGMVYAPLGPTHQALDDFSLLRTLPNMTIVSPCDSIEMEKLVVDSLNWPHPIYIRIAKGGDPIITSENDEFKIGKAVLMNEPDKVLIISTGIMTQIAKEVVDYFKTKNINIGILHLHTIKPLDTEVLKSIITNVENIITLEEHYRDGGLGTSILEFCSETMPEHLYKIKRFGFNNKFSKNYGSQKEHINFNSLDSQSISSYIEEKI